MNHTIAAFLGLLLCTAYIAMERPTTGTYYDDIATGVAPYDDFSVGGGRYDDTSWGGVFYPDIITEVTVPAGTD